MIYDAAHDPGKGDSRRPTSMSAEHLDRRDFLKVSGGIAGILAAGRAPAFAQGTKLHWVRWVDFIPESDVELKRSMADASKALGAEVQLETINANDLQPRITAAIQSGSGADIFNFQYNWPHLYQNAVVDVSDVVNEVAKAEGASTTSGRRRARSTASGCRCRTRSSAMP